MRVSLNLATHPYVELGPVYLRLRIVIVVLALLAVPLWLLARVEKERAQEAHGRLMAVQQDTAALQHEEQSYENDMRQPRNAAVLRQSKFLNRMFQEKAFSWTAVMMDLENVLPTGVQVENIDPAVVARTGNVIIHLRVNGAHDRAVDLVRNLEHSRRFLFPRLAGETLETTQPGRSIQQTSYQGVNFDILADYNPLPVADERAPGKSAAKGKEKTRARPYALTRRRKERNPHSPRPQKAHSPQPRKAGPQ